MSVSVPFPAAPRLPGWRALRPLAQGAQSHVWLVAREGGGTDAPRVARVMRLVGDRGYPMDGDEQRWRVLREVAALQSLERAGCRGVVRILDHGLRTAGTEHAWVVTDWHPLGGMRWFDGTTFRYRERLQGRVSRVMELAGTLAGTLAVLHAHTPRMAHRDVHLGNVLLDAPGGPPVLGDFGSVWVEGFAPRPAVPQPILSTPWLWRAPELDLGAASGPAADVYMLGGVIYEGLSGGGLLPCPCGAEGGWMHEAPEHALSAWSMDPRISQVNALLRRMLAPDPADRCSAAEAARACRSIRRAGVLHEPAAAA